MVKYFVIWYVIGFLCLAYWQIRFFLQSPFGKLAYRDSKLKILKYILITSLFGPACYLIGLLGFEISRME